LLSAVKNIECLPTKWKDCFVVEMLGVLMQFVVFIVHLMLVQKQ
jgi:hypothetical protein